MVLFIVQDKLNRFIAKTTISVVENDRFIHTDKDTKQNFTLNVSRKIPMSLQSIYLDVDH